MSQQAKKKARSPEQIGADIADRFAGLMMSEQRALAEKIAEVIKAERSANDALVKALGCCGPVYEVDRRGNRVSE